MEVYWALINKRKYATYTEMKNYLKNNFNKIMENFNDPLLLITLINHFDSTKKA